jgi:fused signal recognition particle receptor
MDQLAKIGRVIGKRLPGAPHEVLQVLDATTGQNAVQQAAAFHQAMPVTGLILAKLDGTARGGVIFPILEQVGLPVKFIGVGEGLDDLQPFAPEEFVEALFE